MHLNGRSSPESKSEALAFDLLCSYTVCENGEFEIFRSIYSTNRRLSKVIFVLILDVLVFISN